MAGSETMLDLSRGWATRYTQLESGRCEVELGGGGSSSGIEALLDGRVHVACSSRQARQRERSKCQQETGQELTGHIVAFDAVSIYVHESNPIKEIGIEQLRALYGTTGEPATWAQLGVSIPGLDSEEIHLISRDSGSGTYRFFRDNIVGAELLRDSVTLTDSSSAMMESIRNDPLAIGYSGCGVDVDGVRAIALKATKNEDAILPSVSSVRDGRYKLSRPLRLYTLGKPDGELREFLNWVLSVDGQRIVVDLGYYSAIVR